jgi:hypothetical protein
MEANNNMKKAMWLVYDFDLGGDFEGSIFE